MFTPAVMYSTLFSLSSSAANTSKPGVPGSHTLGVVCTTSSADWQYNF